MKISFFLCLFTILLSCSGSERPDTTIQEDLTDFEIFYQQFHADSLYQMQHIAFPLAGLPANADTLGDTTTFFWQKENWVLHRNLTDRLSGYERKRKKFGSNIIVETIVQKDSEIGMMRRFAKMDDEWMLIYYTAMNQMQPSE